MFRNYSDLELRGEEAVTGQWSAVDTRDCVSVSTCGEGLPITAMLCICSKSSFVSLKRRIMQAHMLTTWTTKGPRHALMTVVFLLMSNRYRLHPSVWVRPEITELRADL